MATTVEALDPILSNLRSTKVTEWVFLVVQKRGGRGGTEWAYNPVHIRRIMRRDIASPERNHAYPTTREPPPGTAHYSCTQQCDGTFVGGAQGGGDTTRQMYFVILNVFGGVLGSRLI